MYLSCRSLFTIVPRVQFSVISCCQLGKCVWVYLNSFGHFISDILHSQGYIYSTEVDPWSLPVSIRTLESGVCCCVGKNIIVKYLVCVCFTHDSSHITTFFLSCSVFEENQEVPSKRSSHLYVPLKGCAREKTSSGGRHTLILSL